MSEWHWQQISKEEMHYTCFVMCWLCTQRPHLKSSYQPFHSLVCLANAKEKCFTLTRLVRTAGSETLVSPNLCALNEAIFISVKGRPEGNIQCHAKSILSIRMTLTLFSWLYSALMKCWAGGTDSVSYKQTLINLVLWEHFSFVQ